MKVIVVDDNVLNLELTQALLESEGHTVTLLSDAQSFRRWLSQGSVPDLVLMDILLPDALGTALLAELRQRPAWAAIPVVAVTAQALSGDRSRLLAAGFDEVVTKPLDTRTFVAQVSALVRGRALGG